MDRLKDVYGLHQYGQYADEDEGEEGLSHTVAVERLGLSTEAVKDSNNSVTERLLISGSIKSLQVLLATYPICMRATHTHTPLPLPPYPPARRRRSTGCYTLIAHPCYTQLGFIKDPEGVAPLLAEHASEVLDACLHILKIPDEGDGAEEDEEG